MVSWSKIIKQDIQIGKYIRKFHNISPPECDIDILMRFRHANGNLGEPHPHFIKERFDILNLSPFLAHDIFYLIIVLGFVVDVVYSRKIRQVVRTM